MLAALLRVLAPRKAHLVALIQAYFDESDSHDGAVALTVAGFVFTSEESLKLDEKWLSVLERYELPYFHMVDCAHGNRPFDKLTKEQCIAVEKEMIAIIREHVLFGMAVSIPERDYDEIFPRGYAQYGSAYSYCCHTCIAVVNEWIKANYVAGETAYFFEAGHKSQNEANRIMNAIFANPTQRRDYRYAGHSFGDKKKLRPLQAADLFAWLNANQAKRVLRGEKTMRADLRALLTGRPLEGRIITRHDLINMRTQIELSLAGTLITGKYGTLPFVALPLR